MNSNAKRPTGKMDIWAMLNHTAILLAFLIGFLADNADCRFQSY
ncbi:MAG: hypothetical protein AAB417_02365 [Patescibacteria group bacterium]